MALAPSTRSSILVVDDDPEIRRILTRLFERDGFEVGQAPNGEGALAQLAQHPFDVVLMDVHMDGLSGIDVLRRMRERGMEQPVVIMSGDATLQMAVGAVREGALDFIDKPLRPDRVRLTIDNALRYARLAAEHETLTQAAEIESELLGDSPPMEALRVLVAKAAPSEGRVLVTGENGTGKELVARAIHRGSARRDRPFVKLNCAAVPADLIESELFGHEKGAFTGAVAAKAGKFEQAHKGTLLLDEVGDMPAMMQAKLLRVLQEGELERVGSTQSRAVDVRVVAATNQDLPAMIEAGEFREDLYYRLAVVTLQVPPLRQRLSDVPALAEGFLRQAIARNNRRPMRWEPGALRRLCEHDYPGNVRELRNVVERLVILGEDDAIREADVDTAFGRRAAVAETATLYRDGVPFRDLLADAERGILREALRRHDGNMTETAAALDLERSHLYKKLKALRIQRPAR
jgi:DNA-binding NtrC family response regulator